jgi:hypothetical protein
MRLPFRTQLVDEIHAPTNAASSNTHVENILSIDFGDTSSDDDAIFNPQQASRHRIDNVPLHSTRRTRFARNPLAHAEDVRLTPTRLLLTYIHAEQKEEEDIRQPHPASRSRGTDGQYTNPTRTLYGGIENPPSYDSGAGRTLADVYRKMNRDPYAGASNNSPRQAALLRVLGELGLRRNESVFLDAGSGFGIPCIAVALFYGVRCYGVEHSVELVERSKIYAREAGVADLCTFEHLDIKKLDGRWLTSRGITHIYSFDRVFLPKTGQYLCDLIVSYAIGNRRPLQKIVTCFKQSESGPTYWNRSLFSTIFEKRFQMSSKGGSWHTFYVLEVRPDFELEDECVLPEVSESGIPLHQEEEEEEEEAVHVLGPRSRYGRRLIPPSSIRRTNG